MTIGASASLDFAGHGIEIIGPVSGGFPHLALPPLDWNLIRTLLPTAGACSIMIVAQSAVTARAYAIRHHQALDSNQDLLGLTALVGENALFDRLRDCVDAYAAQ